MAEVTHLWDFVEESAGARAATAGADAEGDAAGGELTEDDLAAWAMLLSNEELMRLAMGDEEEDARIALLQAVAEDVVTNPPPPVSREGEEKARALALFKAELDALDAAKAARDAAYDDACNEAEAEFRASQHEATEEDRRNRAARDKIDQAASDVLLLIDFYDRRQQALKDWIERSRGEFEEAETARREELYGELRHVLDEVAEEEASALPSALQAAAIGDEERRQAGLREMRRGMRSASRRRKEAAALSATELLAAARPLEDEERALRAAFADEERAVRAMAVRFMDCRAEIRDRIEAEDENLISLRGVHGDAQGVRGGVEASEACCRDVWERLGDLEDARRRIMAAAEELRAAAVAVPHFAPHALPLTSCTCSTAA
eukprot:TRINITY_DN8797_c0_g2_i3.p1 TRINITY_DN8797_c0_g2~~TRINITY_DN8797_c0_g2_i3.p1  ORF type:complete len:379 (+),score=164.85 TRINITY_DN8797_c0_g2_i3:119-1255(+)